MKMCMPSRMLSPLGPLGILPASGGVHVRRIGWLVGGCVGLRSGVCLAARCEFCATPWPAKTVVTTARMSRSFCSRIRIIALLR
jgi:hypothetical protein